MPLPPLVLPFEGNPNKIVALAKWLRVPTPDSEALGSMPWNSTTSFLHFVHVLLFAGRSVITGKLGQTACFGWKVQNHTTRPFWPLGV